MRFLTLATLLALAGPAFACSCGNPDKPPACEVYAKWAMIFRARLIDHNHDPNRGYQNSLFRFRVEEPFKGVPGAEVFVPGGGSCSRSDYLPGKDYVFYVHRSSNRASQYQRWTKQWPAAWKNLGSLPVFDVTFCDPSGVVEPNSPDLAYLRLAAAGKLPATARLWGIASQNLDFDTPAEDLVPVPGAAVSVTQGSRSWRTVTDQRGRYAFENLPGGEFRLALTKAKFAPVGSHIQISPGACLVLRSYFRTQSTISGIALDANGRPLPGLDLGLYQVQDDGRLRNLGNYVRAGPDGRFMLENIPTGPVIIGANVNRVPNDFEPFDPVFATSPTNAG